MFFSFQAEDGIRDLVRSRGLGDVYKRQGAGRIQPGGHFCETGEERLGRAPLHGQGLERLGVCLLYTSDAADERSSVDLGGRRCIKKKKTNTTSR